MNMFRPQETIEDRNGFTIIRYKDGELANKGLVYVAMHAGPQIERTPQRDPDSDLAPSVAMHEKTGGTLIYSCLPRDQRYGIDFNRKAPTKKQAIEQGMKEKIDGDFLKEYAWIARGKNREEMERYHRKNMRRYKAFWDAISESGNTFILSHTMSTRPGYLPTIFDIVTLDEKGIERARTEKIANMLNGKYDHELSGEVKEELLHHLLSEINREARRYGRKELTAIVQKWLEKDLAFIRNVNPQVADRLAKNYTIGGYMKAAKEALENYKGKPQITVENVFRGEGCDGPKERILNRDGVTAVNVESSQFMLRYFGDLSVDVLTDLAFSLYDPAYK